MKPSDLENRWKSRDTDGRPWVIRSDFSDAEKWKEICGFIQAPQLVNDEEIVADVRYINDKQFQDLRPHPLVAALPDNYPDKFVFVVDRECLNHPEHPVSVVGFYPVSSDDNDGEFAPFLRYPREAPPGEITTFRVIPAKLFDIQCNLSLGNMDFEDYADSVDTDGGFRGFGR